MKKSRYVYLLFNIFLLLLLLAGCTTVLPNSSFPPASRFACTGFAVYGNETWYGMNFDYPEVPLRIRIEESGPYSVLWLEFQQETYWAQVVAMNSAGLFGSNQYLLPETPHHAVLQEDQIFTWQLFSETMRSHSNVQAVQQSLQHRNVVNGDISLHMLVADIDGEAIVIEPSQDQHVVTEMAGAFMLMTNFANYKFLDVPYTAVEGVGAERYKTAYAAIQQTGESLSLWEGLDVLSQARSTGEWATRSSIVFNPAEQTAFLVLDTDFDRVWKISLANHTIETFAGFGPKQQWPIPYNGINLHQIVPDSPRLPSWLLNVFWIALASLATGMIYRRISVGRYRIDNAKDT